MGLDWIVENKPCEGNEKEFKKLTKKLKKLREEEPGNEEIGEIEDRLEEISFKPYDAMDDYTEEELNELDEIFVGGSFLTSSFDFRGKQIGHSELIEEELKDEAYEDHNPKECIEYAEKLELSISAYNKETMNEDEKEDYDNVNRGIKWLKFWGKHGYGFTAWS